MAYKVQYFHVGLLDGDVRAVSVRCWLASGFFFFFSRGMRWHAFGGKNKIDFYLFAFLWISFLC